MSNVIKEDVLKRKDMMSSVRENTKDEVSKRIFLLCYEKGFTYSKLARMTNISVTSFSNWKNRGGHPSYEQLQRISRALGVSMGYLLYGTISSFDSTDQMRDLTERISFFSEDTQKLLVDVIENVVEAFEKKYLVND